jgi:hypothetical protein
MAEESRLISMFYELLAHAITMVTMVTTYHTTISTKELET